MFYFLHIAKCAGTSFVSLAKQNVDVYRPSSNGNPINPLNGRTLRFWEWPVVEEQHFLSSGSWQFVANETCLGARHEFFEGVAYIVILREPLDRLFSAFQFMQAKPDRSVPLAERGRLFVRFLTEQRGSHWRRNKLIASLTDEGRKRPAERLELAKGRLAQFDHIFFVETLAEDVRSLTHHGWDKADMPWRNARAPGEPGWSAAREALTDHPEVLAQLLKENAEDLELYAYAQELVRSRQSAAPALERIPMPSERIQPESDNFDFLVCCAYEFYLAGDESRCRELLCGIQEMPAAEEFGVPSGDSFAEFALQQFRKPGPARGLHRKLRKERRQARRPGA